MPAPRRVMQNMVESAVEKVVSGQAQTMETMRDAVKTASHMAEPEVVKPRLDESVKWDWDPSEEVFSYGFIIFFI